MASSARIDELKKKFDENPRRYFAPLANEYRKVGDLDQAVFICEAYLPQQPGHMSGHIVYAQTLFELGRFDDSKAAFGSALALDPENLIALRHLGDIARQAGDLNTAREWYQRVLEADPRNEEIVEVMASLRKVTMGGAAPGAPMVSASSPEAQPLRTPPVSAQPPAYSAPTPAAPAPVSPPPAEEFEEDDLLDLDSLVIGETPLSTTAASSAAAGQDDAAFESDPLAIAANEPPIELATDIHLGLIDDGTQSDVAPAPDAPPLEGLRSYEAGTLADKVEVVDSSLEMEPFYDILHGETAPPEEAQSEPVESLHGESTSEPVAADPVAAPSEEAVDIASDDRLFTPAVPSTPVREPTPPAPAEVFITETMAELYLQQGHLDSALDIYRKLLDQRPNDSVLVERVKYVEARVFGAPSEAPGESEAAESIDTPLADAAESGPTIREFLVGLIRGRDGNTAQSNGSTTSRHTLPGSIDAMFPDAAASTGDSSAATALGEAFGMEDFDVELPGETRRASTGTSADPVLSGNTPPTSQAASEGFSFDQFFSGDANAVPPKPSVEAGAPPVESPDDIAQFNAWLNGLKKT
jgi:tetratricopeptide (TPR) repeat protein